MALSTLGIMQLILTLSFPTFFIGNPSYLLLLTNHWGSAMGRIRFTSLTKMATRLLVMPGFAPAGEPLLFRKSGQNPESFVNSSNFQLWFFNFQ